MDRIRLFVFLSYWANNNVDSPHSSSRLGRCDATHIGSDLHCSILDMSDLPAFVECFSYQAAPKCTIGFKSLVQQGNSFTTALCTC